jgi:hypothetical protein
MVDTVPTKHQAHFAQVQAGKDDASPGIGMLQIPRDPIHRRKFMKKATWSKGKFGWILLCLWLLLCNTQAVHITNSQPILWRASKTPIISGYEKVYLRLDLFSPCSLLTADTVHADNLDTAEKLCNEMYQKRFLDELEKMCPREGHHQVHRINKRFVIIGGLIIAGIFMAGVGIGGLTLGVINYVRIGELEDAIDVQQRTIDGLAQETNLTQLAHEKLRHDFNILAHGYEVHERDYNEFKDKAPTTQFVFSSIISGLTMGSIILKGATRDWKKGTVSPLLMDYLNITLPCGEKDCPLDLATAQRCSFTSDMRSVNMELYVPKINSKMHLVEADPFDIMLRTWNQTCRIVYNGPTTAVLAPTGCPVAMNIQTSKIYEMVYSPTDACMEEMENQTTTFYHVKQCHSRKPGDEREFIQVKSHHGFYHIYCYGSTIKVEGQKQECPNEVFILPVGTKFTINDQDFVGSIVNVHHQENPDPLFTLRTNQRLKPRIDYPELMKDPLINHSFKYKYDAHTDHHWSPLTLGILICFMIIFVILIGIIAKCYFCNRKVIIKVGKATKRQVPQVPATPEEIQPY